MENCQELSVTNNVLEAVEDYVKQEGYVKHSIKISPGSNKGDNYMGIVYKLTVDCVRKDGSVVQKLLMCKLPPSSAARREQFKAKNCFDRETYVYTKIIPEFLRFQDEKQSKTRFQAYAKCVAASYDMLEEFVLMEDLRPKGFFMFNRHQKLDLNHVALVMQELGRYHAFSFALKDQKPELFRELANIKDVFFDGTTNEAFNMYVNSLVIKAVGCLDEDDPCREKVAQMKNMIQLGHELIDGNAAEPYAVINHGDCWNNNVLFRYDHGCPCDIRLLDWQIARYSSPALDLVYYIFCCTEEDFRKRHFNTLLHIYHGALSDFLRELGSDPDKLFPFSALQQQMMKFGKFGLLMGLMVIQAMIVQPDEVPDLDELAKTMQNDPENMKFIEGTEASDLIYNRRMGGIIHDMDRLGYI